MQGFAEAEKDREQRRAWTTLSSAPAMYANSTEIMRRTQTITMPMNFGMSLSPPSCAQAVVSESAPVL